MTSHIEDYLNARQAYEETRKEIMQIADDILAVATVIKRDPARFSFVNSGLDLPRETFSGQFYPAEEWLSAVDIQKHLQKLHEIRLLLRSSWAQIPANLKSGLQPPPAGVLPPQRYEVKGE